MKQTNWTHRIAKDGILLAFLCVVGMFSIPLGDNVKVSLQLYAVILLCFLVDGFLDAVLVSGCYLLMGLLLPIYAGFSSGISATFGFVIGFVVASPAYYFLAKLPLPKVVRLIISGILGTLIVYACGTFFMMFYLNWDLGTTLMVSVVPYLPFDAVKIALAIVTSLAIPAYLTSEDHSKHGKNPKA